jgi:hypothetical protein
VYQVSIGSYLLDLHSVSFHMLLSYAFVGGVSRYSSIGVMTFLLHPVGRHVAHGCDHHGLVQPLTLAIERDLDQLLWRTRWYSARKLD